MEIDGGVYGERAASEVAVRAGLATVLYLGGGLALGFVLGIAISNVPLHMSELLKNIGGAVGLLTLLSLASHRWGSTMAALSGWGDRPWAARIGGLSFPIVLFAAALALSAGEALFEIGLPIHVLYGALFVPTSFLIVALVSVAWGKALKDWNLGGKLALGAAPPAGLAFFLVYLLMDAIRYRVGAPGAGEKATMITVTFVGCLAAAAAGGAALGIGLRKASREKLIAGRPSKEG